MSAPEPTPSAAARLRREPPRWRRATVAVIDPVSPRLVRVTLRGPDLVDLAVDAPAASVRLLLPAAATGALEVPDWNGNEFRRADGSRPTIRTLTPWRVDADAGEVEVGVVLHGGGALSDWAAGGAAVGEPVALSGPGRGYTPDPDAPAFVVLGDETAIPAIDQVLDALPADATVHAHIEIAAPEAASAALAPTRTDHITWHPAQAGDAPGDRLLAAVTDLGPEDLTPGVAVWAAGEAAAMQRIRRHLFEERGLSRRQATVRGYWKHGRASGGDDDG